MRFLGLGKLLIAIVCISLFNFIRTPFKQRNEARIIVSDLEAKLEDKKRRDQIKSVLGTLISNDRRHRSIKRVSIC